MTNERACPCGPPEHPAPIANLPGRSFIRYRAGDFASFRRALLTPLPGEQELVSHAPGAEGDLAVQALEWWAYLADILTFYNEQIANRAYLRTAGAGDVERLVKLLGYRPRPGLGARGTIAALVQAKLPVLLRAGLGFQSKPGPGEEPQIFALDKESTVDPGGAVAADLAADDSITPTSLLLRGSVTVNPGELLLLVSRSWSSGSSPYTVIHVKTVAPEKDPAGRTNTRVTAEVGSPAHSPSVSGAVSGYRLMRPSQTSHLYAFQKATTVISDASSKTTAHLDGTARSLSSGDFVLVRYPGLAPELRQVDSYGEIAWYANTSDEGDPTKGPASDKEAGISVLHSVLTLNPNLANTSTYNTPKANRGAVQLLHGFRDAGVLWSVKKESIAKTVTLQLASPISVPASGRPVIVEDATGGGGLGKLSPPGSDPLRVEVTFEQDSQPLEAPLRVLTNLLPVSRGAAVAREVLGSGDATLPAQRFVLQKAPLTYEPVTLPAFPRGYKSSLTVSVNGIEWTEVERFYGQPAGAQIFVTAEDASGKTAVLFGDGIHGARLPSGQGNVVASYRYGSGSKAPAPGALSVVLKPVPGLTGVRGPVPPAGGTSPDPADRTRTLAPRTVFTFGRAVSPADYEALAQGSNGVTRARAYFSWDVDAQRTTVVVYVTGDSGAVAAARKTLKANGDPNRNVEVKPATNVGIRVSLIAVYDSRYDKGAVQEAVAGALADEETGLFGGRSLPIGKAVYDSGVVAACMAVPGVVAVHSLVVFLRDPVNASLWKVEATPRHDPGEGKVLTLATLTVSMEKADVVA